VAEFSKNSANSSTEFHISKIFLFLSHVNCILAEFSRFSINFSEFFKMRRNRWEAIFHYPPNFLTLRRTERAHHARAGGTWAGNRDQVLHSGLSWKERRHLRWKKKRCEKKMDRTSRKKIIEPSEHSENPLTHLGAHARQFNTEKKISNLNHNQIEQLSWLGRLGSREETSFLGSTRCSWRTKSVRIKKGRWKY
jgi:hypothetical protein